GQELAGARPRQNLDRARPVRRADRIRDRRALRARLRLALARSALGVPLDRARSRRVRPGALEYGARPLRRIDAESRTVRSALVLSRSLLPSAPSDRSVLCGRPEAGDAHRRSDDRARARRVADLPARAPLPSSGRAAP